MRYGSRFLIGLIPVALALAACGGVSPETRIRERLSDAVQAAENRDLGALRAFISEGYADPVGRDKRAIEGLLALYLRQNEGLHLFAVTRTVTLTSSDGAEATVLVAMAARPIHDEAELRTLSADLYQVDIRLVRESREWNVAEAFWEPVSVF